MKPRRVFVTIEMETNVSLADLRNRDAWAAAMLDVCRSADKETSSVIHQVQVNVAREILPPLRDRKAEES